MARSKNSGPHGIAVIDKPAGITSHGVVGRLRFELGTRKVGHAGTLDPMATGVLVFGVGKGTKLLTYITGVDKEYTATIRLGAATFTDDAMGEVTSWASAPLPSLDQVREATVPLTGDIMQRPSAVSAIKVDGKRAYKRARSGEDVELKERPVTVSEFEVLGGREAEFDGHQVFDVDVRVACSSGTYIRALARDLGETFSVGGHLTALRRTRVGPFTEDVTTPAGGDVPLLPLGRVASMLMPCETLSDAWCEDIVNGRLIERENDRVVEPIAALDDAGELVAIVKQTTKHLRPVTVFRTAPPADAPTGG